MYDDYYSEGIFENVDERPVRGFPPLPIRRRMMTRETL